MAQEQAKVRTIVIRNHVHGKADVNIRSKRRLRINSWWFRWMSLLTLRPWTSD